VVLLGDQTGKNLGDREVESRKRTWSLDNGADVAWGCPHVARTQGEIGGESEGGKKGGVYARVSPDTDEGGNFNLREGGVPWWRGKGLKKKGESVNKKDDLCLALIIFQWGTHLLRKKNGFKCKMKNTRGEKKIK